MATSSPVRPSPAARSEAFVARQLQQARQRIRLLDATASLLGWACLTLAYGLGMIVADRSLDLPALARQGALGGYLLLSAAYLGYTLIRPLCRRLNPYYAARQVEQTLPQAKNSVINWLDLHEQPLPASIRAAVSHRAAEDLAEADLESAISGRRNLWLTGVLSALGLGLFIQLVIGGPQFFSLLRRAFAPFSEGSIATRTQLTLLKPENGDVTVPVGRAVTFTVQVRGKLPSANRPEALRLLYRYHAEDPFEEQRLEPGDTAGEWATIVAAHQVHNGFWYKVAGGDAETPEYRVSVRSTPLLTDFDVTYRFRPYLGWKEQTAREPNLKAVRGTEVNLIARANRNVREGRLELIEQKKFITGERVPGEPHALRFTWVLDDSGSYRIAFVSEDDERNSDPMPYEIKVLPDLTPRVTLTPPGKPEWPLNEKLTLRGAANDDFGLANVTLRLQTKDGPLAPLPYPKGGLKRQADGSPPRNVEYQEALALDQLLQAGEKLKPGTELEYWLEAADLCDYPPPGPNVGRSEKFTIKLVEPIADPKNEPQPQQQKKDPNQADKPGEQQKNDPGKGDQPKPDQPQPSDKKQDQPNGDQKQQGDSKQEQGAGGQAKPDASQEPKPGDGAQSPEDKKLQEQKERLEQALRDNEKQQQSPDGNAGQDKSPDGKKPQDQQKPSPNGENGGKPQDQLPSPNGSDGQKPDQPPSPNGSNGDKPDQKPSANNSDGAKPDQKPSPNGDNGDKAKPDPRQQTGQTDGKKPDQQPGKPEGGQPPPQQPGAKDQKPEGAGAQPKENQPGKQQEKGNDPGNPQSGKPDAAQPEKQPGSQGDPAKNDPKPGAGDKQNGTESSTGQGKPDQKPPQAGQGSDPKQGEPKSQQQPNQGAAGRKETNDAGNNAKQEVGKPDADQGGNPRLEKPDPSLKEKLDQMPNADPQTKQKLLDQLKEAAKDPQKREALEQQVKESLKDPQTREAVERMLKEAAKDGDKQPGPKSGNDRPQNGDGPKTERNEPGKPTDPCPNAGTTKGEADKPPTTPGQEAQGTSKPQQGKDPNPQSKGDGPAPKDKPTRQAGNEPGIPGDGPREGSAPNNNADAPEAAPADPRFQKKAGELQLEDFRKRVNKDVLQKANMTEAEYRQFLQAYEAMLKRRPPEAAAKGDKLADPKRAGGTLQNLGPRRVQGGPTQDAVQGGAQRHAPPEYLDKYNEFTEKLSNRKRAKDR